MSLEGQSTPIRAEKSWEQDVYNEIGFENTTQSARQRDLHTRGAEAASHLSSRRVAEVRQGD
jgi:hypothetical protein